MHPAVIILSSVGDEGRMRHTGASKHPALSSKLVHITFLGSRSY